MVYDVNQYMIFLFVACRMSGLIFFNPIFGRQSIPMVLKIGLAMALAINASYSIGGVYVADYGVIELILSMAKEFAIGFAIGYVLYVFLGIFHVSGFLADMQMGFGMALMYDPASNSQISISGNILTIMFTLLFLITNSHLTLMAVVTQSFAVVPVGIKVLSTDAEVFAIELFGYMLVYALQLALPLIVVEIITEVAVGIMMKMVPNINVFVVNMQLKMLIGFVIILTLVPAFVSFLSKLNSIMLESIQDMIMFLV